MNVLQNFSMRKIHPKWEKTSKATWSCAKSGMFCFRKKSSSFFLKNFPHFFFLEKILPVFQYWFWHYETLLWIILENFSLWKIFAKKNGKNIWGEKFIISNQSFLFSKFSIQCQPLFPPFGCARFWTKKSQDKSVTFYYFFAFRFVNSVVEIWNVIVSVSSSFLIKNHLVFQTNGIKLWKSQKPSQQKFKGSKNIFCDAIFSSIWLQSVAKIVENKMAVFLWKRKKLKGKKFEELSSPKKQKKNGCPFSVLPWTERVHEKNCVFFKQKKILCYFVVLLSILLSSSRKLI